MGMTTVMKVETKMITSIADSPIERAEIFVIMYVTITYTISVYHHKCCEVEPLS
jgi:hypothetical protein